MLSYLPLVFLVFISLTEAVWYDVISANGWDIGDGMVFRIEDTKMKNSSFWDRIAFKADYGDVEVSAVQKPEKEAVQLDFYIKNQEEGRANNSNMGNMLIPFFIGAAKGSAITMVVSAMKFIALKALVLAKAALIIMAVLIASKYMKKDEPYYVEVESHSASEQIPVYGYAGVNTIDHAPSIAYHAYAPSAAAESALSYATVVEPPVHNETAPVKQYHVQPASKRRDHGRPKVTPAVLMIRQYSQPESGLI